MRKHVTVVLNASRRRLHINAVIKCDGFTVKHLISAVQKQSGFNGIFTQINFCDQDIPWLKIIRKIINNNIRLISEFFFSHFLQKPAIATMHGPYSMVRFGD